MQSGGQDNAPSQGSAGTPLGLPSGVLGVEPPWIELNLHDEELRPKAGYPYRVVFADGSVREGKLDGNGHARIEGVPNKTAEVFFGDSPKPFSAQPVKALKVAPENLADDLRKLGLDPATVDLQSLVERAAGRAS